MLHLQRGRQRLADFLQQVAEPGLGGVEGLAALDARKFDGAQLVAALLIVPELAFEQGSSEPGGLAESDAFYALVDDTLSALSEATSRPMDSPHTRSAGPTVNAAKKP